MVVYNINVFHNKEFFELACLSARHLLMNGGVKPSQIRVSVTKEILSFSSQHLSYLNGMLGFGSVRAIPNELTDWCPKTYIVDGLMNELEIDDVIVNVDADLFLTQQIDLDEFVINNIRGYDIALYNWNTNPVNSYRDRWSLFERNLRPTFSSSLRYRNCLNGIIAESGLTIEEYESELPNLVWMNGGFTIYQNKNLTQNWKSLLLLNSFCMSDEFAFSILDFTKQKSEVFGLNINRLTGEKTGLTHHYLGRESTLTEVGLMHLIGATKNIKRNEIQDLYNRLIVEH